MKNSHKRIGDLCRIKHGWAFKGEHFSSTGKYILLSPGNFYNGGGLKLKGEKEKFYIGDFPQEYLLNKGDLLIAMTDLVQSAPLLGGSAIVPKDNLFLHNQRLGKVVDVDTSLVTKDFLYWFFNTESYRAEIRGSATGATVRHTAPERVYNCKINLPSLEIQKKISGLLLSYNRSIENNQKRINLLEKMAQRIYTEWFVDFKFPAYEKSKLIESELGRIPKGWKFDSLKNAAVLVMGQSPASEFYNESGVGLPFHQGVTNFGDRFPTDKTYSTKETRIAEKGDILFSVRAPVGRMNLCDKRIIIGRGISAIRSKTGNQTFLYYQLKNQFSKEDSMGSGAIFNAVTKSDMQNIRLLMPSQNTVDAYEKIAEPISKQIETLVYKIRNLEKTRDMILPRLISGDLDVAELEVKL